MRGTGAVNYCLDARGLRALAIACLAGVALALVVAIPAHAGPATKSFSFSKASYDANETDASVLITVTRSTKSGQASVVVSTSDGSGATAGTDYRAVSATLSFRSGELSKTVSVTILDDQGPSEPATATVNLGLSSPSKGYTVGPPSVLTIHEDAAPLAPANLAASSDPYDVNLGWEPSSGASSYTVSRSTTSGSGYAPLGSTSGTTFIDSNAAGGPYYYVVTASNDDGPSANSNEASGAASGANLLTNGDFETGDLSGWTAVGNGLCVNACRVAPNVPAPSIDNTTVLGGSFSAFLGQPTTCFPGEDSGQAYIYQSVAVPSGTTLLTWHYNGQSDDSYGFDGQQVLITDGTGATVIATPQGTADNSRTWTARTYDLSGQAGNTVRIYFRVYENGDNIRSCTAMNVDNVSVVNTP